MVVIGLLLFVIVCELAAIYDRQNGGTVIYGHALLLIFTVLV